MRFDTAGNLEELVTQLNFALRKCTSVGFASYHHGDSTATVQIDDDDDEVCQFILRRANSNWCSYFHWYTVSYICIIPRWNYSMSIVKGTYTSAYETSSLYVTKFIFLLDSQEHVNDESYSIASLYLVTAWLIYVIYPVF